MDKINRYGLVLEILQALISCLSLLKEFPRSNGAIYV